MAKTSPLYSERSKVRIFFVEGDFAAGDLQQLTHALTSAIRPSQAVSRGSLPRRVETAAPTNGSQGSEVSEDQAELFEVSPVEDGEPAVLTEAKRAPRVRKHRSPDAVDIDLTSGTRAWKEFASEKGPDSHREKYLVSAAWLHEHRDLKTIKSDHVFTCYKGAGWNFDIQDPTQTFRQLKAERLGALSREGFAINHLGIAEVNDMKASA